MPRATAQLVAERGGRVAPAGRGPRPGSPCRAGRSPPRRPRAAPSKSCGGMTPPTTIMMSSRPAAASSLAQRRHQGEVPGGQRGDADDVHVGLDRLPGHLGRRLEQRADVDVEAEVGEGGGDHLLAAVVAVLAHLGDQDARPAALRLARTASTSARACSTAGGLARLLAVHTGDRTDLPGVPPVDLLQRVGDLADGRHARGPRRPRAPAGCPPGRGPGSRPAASVSARSASWQAASSRSARSRRSLSICWARTAALSTLSTSICSSVSDPVLVDADHRLAAGVDARLGAGRGLLDAQLRDARVDGLGHAAGRLDLLDVLPGPARPGRGSAARRRRCRPTGR